MRMGKENTWKISLPSVGGARKRKKGKRNGDDKAKELYQAGEARGKGNDGRG